MESNADYIIEKLREFNFPFPRKGILPHQVDEILEELDQIEASTIGYRKLILKIKSMNSKK